MARMQRRIFVYVAAIAGWLIFPAVAFGWGSLLGLLYPPLLLVNIWACAVALRYRLGVAALLNAIPPLAIGFLILHHSG